MPDPSGLHYCADCGYARKYGTFTAYGWICRVCLLVVEHSQVISTR